MRPKSDISPLTPAEAKRLTLFKVRYSAEAHGFSRQQAARLAFWHWLASEHSETAVREREIVPCS